MNIQLTEKYGFGKVRLLCEVEIRIESLHPAITFRYAFTFCILAIIYDVRQDRRCK